MVEKTLIGIITSHDDKVKNDKLVGLLEKFVEVNQDYLENFAFFFTGGTYDRVMLGKKGTRFPNIKVARPVNDETYKALINKCGVIRLKGGSEGGVTYLSNLIVNQFISILWFYLSPITHHWLIPENLALMRLCDQWSVKRLMNKGSILEWIIKHAKKDIKFNSIDWDSFKKDIRNNKSYEICKIVGRGSLDKDILNLYTFELKEKTPDEQTIALIAHDAMKGRLSEFVLYYKKELKKFNQIFTTATTGKMILDSISQFPRKKIIRFNSGPKGGDIEISTKILDNECDIVVFFIDPLNPHAHIDDIRNVFAACMINDEVLMLTNDIHAREWFESVLRDRFSV